MSQTNTDKYLKNFAQGIDLSNFPGQDNWNYVLVIPVCGEAVDFLSQLMQHQKHQKVLIVVLVNCPLKHEKSPQWQIENNSFIEHIKSQFRVAIELSESHVLFKTNGMDEVKFDVLMLDYNRYPFDPDKGVGLARKIAADTALSLINSKHIKSPWIFSTDADVILPTGYFEVTCDVPKLTSALSLRFNHHTVDSVQNALQKQYDFKLYYYQSGVKFIGAQYDYIPLGSTLVIEASSYAKVRGFPSRSGGEDFYILNKLAKVGKIHQPAQPIINIQIRFSDRVPFGTGPAITKIQQQQQQGKDCLYYHPEIFYQLKSWRLALLNYYNKQQLPSQDQGLNQHWNIEKILLQGISQIKSQQRWNQFIHEWFDAFKILKSVHFLRDILPSFPLDKLVLLPAYQDLIEKLD